MTNSEKKIMQYFRQYHVSANEMLFFNTGLTNSSTSTFQLAMASLIRSGLVNRERRRNAYSLTDDGYAASMSA